MQRLLRKYHKLYVITNTQMNYITNKLKLNSMCFFFKFFFYYDSHSFLTQQMKYTALQKKFKIKNL